MATFDELLNASQPTEAQAMTGSFDDLVNTAPTGLRPLSEKRGGFVASVKRTVGQGVQGAGQLAADIVPGVGQDNAVTQYGREVIEANPTEVQKLSDIPEKPLTAVTEATGNAVASMAGIIGLRALGQGITALSPATGVAAPVVAGVGQLISWLGPTAIAALPSYGGIRDKQIVDSPEAQTSAKDKAVAALGAGTVGFIEQRFGPQNWGAAVLTKEGRARLAKMFSGSSRLGAVGKGLASGAAIEGAEEIVQNPVEQLASYQDPRTPENIEETVFGGAMGAIGGGVIGGGVGGVSYRSQKTKDTIQQRTLANLIEGADISVEGGVATIARGQELPFSMPVETLAAHLADGGAIDTLTREQRYGERGAGFARTTGPAEVGQEDAEAQAFGREALAYNQERNQVGLRRSAAGRTDMMTELSPETELSRYQPTVARPDYAGRTGPATVSQEEAEALSFGREARTVNQLRNEQGLRRAAATTGAVTPEGTPLAEAPLSTYEPTVARPDYAGRTGPATVSQEEAEAQEFKRESLAYNQERNRTGQRRDFPGRETAQVPQEQTPEEALLNSYQPEVPGAVPPPIVRSDGKPFATQRAAESAVKRFKLAEGSYEIQKNKDRFTVVRKGAQEVAEQEATAEDIAAAQADYAAFQKQESNLAKPPKPPKEKPTAPKTTGVKVRFTGTGGGPQVVEVVRKEPAQPGDLPGEEFYTVVNTQTGESGVVSAEDITPVKGQEEAFTNISNAVDKSSESQYSVNEGSYNSRDFKNYDFGEDTSEEAKAAIPVLRKVLVRTKTGAQEGSTITPRKVAGIVQSAVDRIASAFGRRVVFFASSDPAALLPNGFIDKNDPKTIYINTQSGFSPTTILGHEILHAMKEERAGLYNMLRAAAVDKNLKINAFEAYRKKLEQNKYFQDREITKEDVYEEMIADFMGDAFSDPVFWEQLATERPSLFKRMSTYVVTFLNKLIAALKQQKNFQSYQFFIDVQKMRDVAVKAMAQYGGAEAFIGMEPTDIRFAAQAAAKAIFSKLESVATSAFQGMKAQSVDPFLLKQGVKKIEMDAVGLPEFLAGKKPTDKVSREELMNFVQANAIELEDVLLGEPQFEVMRQSEAVRRFPETAGWFSEGREWLAVDRGVPLFEIPDVTTKEEALRAAKQMYRNDLDEDRADVTHFSQYTEPGADEGSYREMFVTAPSKKAEVPPFKNGKEYYESGQYAKDYADLGTSWAKLNAYQRKLVEEAYREASPAYMLQERGEWQDGHSQYNDIKNPIVRIRFNTVTTADGKRILRIEEMQGPSKDNQAKMPAYLVENWRQLAVKRILAYAKEQGLDGVGFATKPGMSAGETQADRYDLSKQVDRVDYYKRPDGRYDIEVLRPGRGTGDEEGIGGPFAAEALEGVVGKELAKKIINDSGEKLNSGWSRMAGLDLKITSTGLVKLYDQDLPRMLEAYGKGKMGEAEIATAPVTQAQKDAKAEGRFYKTQALPYLPLTDKTPASYPMFSIADDALDLGRKKVKEAASSLANPKSRLHDLYVQYAPQWLSVTPLLTLVQTFGKKFPQVAEFARHIDRVVAVKNDIVNKSKELHDEALALAKDGVGEKVLNYAIAISSFNRMTPWKPLMEQDWVPKTGTAGERLKLANVAWKRAKMDEATGLKLHEAYKQARDAYEALGTDAMKTAYEAMVDDLHRVREREKNNLLSFIEQASVGNAALRQQLMARFNATFSELQGAYWPLARVGDFTLSFTEKDGTKVVKHYATTKLRRLDREQLIEDGIPAEAITEGTKDKRTRQETAIPRELMSQLMAAVEAEKMKGVDPKDDAAMAAALADTQDVVNDMNQIWLRWQPETSALKNSLRRKNVRGFSEDMMRSYLDYMSRHASNIAWTEQGRKIEATLKSMTEDIKEAKAAGGADVTMQQNILNDLRGRVQAIREARVGPVASGLGKLGTAYYMTSPSIALVQMSQLAVITYPNMAVKFGKLGLRAVTKALAAGTKAAFSKDFTIKAIFADDAVNDVFDRLHAVVTEKDRAPREDGRPPQGLNKNLGDDLFTREEKLEWIAKLTPSQKQLLALREANARNLLDISAAHEAYELTQGKDPNGLMSKAFRYAMLPMQLSELASRKAAVLGTMDLATQEKKDFFEAMDDVASVVNDTLYSYAKEHKGSALQGGAARVLLQFQHYRIMTIIRLMSLFNNSVRGETPEMKSAARKELIGILGMTGALGGTLGLPLAGGIFALSNALLGDDDEPIDSELMWRNWLRDNFGETLGNVLTTGVPYLVGADLSRRVGMGDMFGMQQTPPPGYHGAKLFTWWATSLLGPVASVGQSGFQGYDEIVNKGNYMKGLEVATPKPIRDALKAIRLGTEGLKTSSGKRLLSEDAIGVDELFLAALGFNPEEVSRAQAAERSLNKMSTLISERRGRIIRDAARGILEGDTREAMQAVLRFNSRMPRYSIKGGDIKGSVRKIISGEIGDAGLRDRQVAAQYEIPSYL